MNPGYSGKLSMGIGGINSCVISRPWPDFARTHCPKRPGDRACSHLAVTSFSRISLLFSVSKGFRKGRMLRDQCKRSIQ